MDSYYVDYKSLRLRYNGGLQVEPHLKVETVGSSINEQDWVYIYTISDLLTEDSDISKLTEIGLLHDGSYVTIERYYIVRSNGMAIALARRIYAGLDSIPVCESYVSGMDKILSQMYRSKVYPFKVRSCYEEYMQSGCDIFSPVLFRAKDIFDEYNHVYASSDPHMGWLDRLALQGWFPSAVLSGIGYDPPPHIGWSTDSHWYNEIQGITDGLRRIHSTDICNDLSYIVSQTPLSDYKATVDIHRPTERVLPETIEYLYHDPKEGTLEDLFKSYRTNADLENLIHGFLLDNYRKLQYHFSDRVITDIVLYRCMNDFVYLILKEDKEYIGYLQCDYAKHMLVHYGFIDIPLKAL